VVIWLQRGANDLHMVQLMPLVPAYPGSPRRGWVKQVSVCLSACHCTSISVMFNSRNTKMERCRLFNFAENVPFGSVILKSKFEVKRPYNKESTVICYLLIKVTTNIVKKTMSVG